MNPGEIEIRGARVDEAESLSGLAVRSKAHWGYSPEFLEACRDELAVRPSTITAGLVLVAARGDDVVGFYELGGAAPHGELAALFVERDQIGTGVGGRLLDHALDTAARRGFGSLVLDADPGAEAFYLRHGARRIGDSLSGSIPGRLLPRLVFELSS